MAHNWYLPPLVNTSAENAARRSSTAPHGSVIVRNGFRTVSRSSPALTSGRRVKANTSGTPRSSANSAVSLVCGTPRSSASPPSQSPSRRSSAPPTRAAGER